MCTEFRTRTVEASASQKRRLHSEDARLRTLCARSAHARTWPPACQSAHGRPPERHRRHWCCGDDGSYKNNTAVPACSKTALCGNAATAYSCWTSIDVSKRLRMIEYNGCAAYVARSGGRTPVMELLCMWPRTADRRKDTSNFLWTVLVPSVSFFDHSNACAARRVTVGRDVLSVSTAHKRVPRR